MVAAIFAYLGHLVGVLIAIYGLFLQKRVYLERESKLVLDQVDQGKRRHILLNPGWIVGFGLLAIGGVLQVVLLTYADLVLLSTNMITAIMFNTFLAIKFLGEKFLWKYDLPAFILMAISAITIIFLANMEEKLFTDTQIKALLGSLRSVLF